MKTQYVLPVILALGAMVVSTQAIATGLTYDPYEVYYSKYYGIGAGPSVVEATEQKDTAFYDPYADYYNTYYGIGAQTAAPTVSLGDDIGIQTRTPAIYLDDEGRGYTDEQEKVYGSVFNFTESLKDQNKSIKRGIEILRQDDVNKEWNNKRKKLLQDKIDVTNFIVRFIETYSNDPISGST